MITLRAGLALGAIAKYPNCECGFEERLAARDHAHGIDDVAAPDLLQYEAGHAPPRLTRRS